MSASPIDLAPDRPARRRTQRRVRRGAATVHLLLAAAVVLGVLAQVYLIGAYVFGAGQGALDAHKAVGYTVHMLECAVLLAALLARLPRPDLGLSAALAVLGTVQVLLAGSVRWIGGLHPLLAMVVLGLAATLAARGGQRRRAAYRPTAAG